MVNTEVKIPIGFVEELIKYLGDKPFSEVENAIYNLRYFTQKTFEEDNGNSGQTTSAS